MKGNAGAHSRGICFISNLFIPKLAIKSCYQYLMLDFFISGHKLPSIHVADTKHVSSTRDSLLSPRPHEFHTQVKIFFGGIILVVQFFFYIVYFISSQKNHSNNIHQVSIVRDLRPVPSSTPSSVRNKTHARSRSDVSGLNKVNIHWRSLWLGSIFPK